MSGTKITIILVIVALLITGGILFVKKVLPNIKRKKLSEGISDYTKTLGKNVTPEEIKKLIEPATNDEVDVLIDFAKKLKAKDFVGALGMGLKVNPILEKTKLKSIFLTP